MTLIKWKTPFTNLFNCRLPIMGAPMAGVAGADLAAETCRAGGLGFLAAGHLNNENAFSELQTEIEHFKFLSEGNDFPLCIGFISHSTFGSDAGWNYFESIIQTFEPNVVQFFAGDIESAACSSRNTNAVKFAQSYGCKVIMQVGSVDHALEAFEYGVDCLCAQGTEAGGHGLRQELGSGTLSLTSKLVELSAARPNTIPILAAGGITDGKDVASVLTLGAAGAVLGTRLWASSEAKGSDRFKKSLVEAESGDHVVRTQVFDTIWNSYRDTKWPSPYDSSSVLRNDFTEKWDNHNSELATILASPDSKSILDDFKKAASNDDPKLACVFSGKGVGKIRFIEPAFEIIMRIEEETIRAIKKVNNVLPVD